MKRNDRARRGLRLPPANRPIARLASHILQHPEKENAHAHRSVVSLARVRRFRPGLRANSNEPPSSQAIEENRRSAKKGDFLMLGRIALVLACCTFAAYSCAQDLSGIEFHGFVTQGFLFSTHNNYLTLQSSSGRLQWTEGAVSISDSVSDNLRVGIQIHMYQLGQLGGPSLHVDWASGDYKVNDYFGVRAARSKPSSDCSTIRRTSMRFFSGLCCLRAVIQSITKAFISPTPEETCMAPYPLARGSVAYATTDIWRRLSSSRRRVHQAIG